MRSAICYSDCHFFFLLVQQNVRGEKGRDRRERRIGLPRKNKRAANIRSQENCEKSKTTSGIWYPVHVRRLLRIGGKDYEIAWIRLHFGPLHGSG